MIRKFDFDSLSEDEKSWIDNARRVYKMSVLRTRLMSIKPKMAPLQQNKLTEVERQESNLVLAILKEHGIDAWNYEFETPEWEELEKREAMIDSIEQYVRELKEAIEGAKLRALKHMGKRVDSDGSKKGNG